MDDLALGDPGIEAGLYGTREDAPEPFGTPALADARQRGMIRQGLMQTVSCEPADGDIHLRFPHQPTVVNDAQQKAGEHQSNRHLGVDARACVDLGATPLINTGILHRVEGGQIGAGIARTPIEPIRDALGALAEDLRL